MRQWNLPLTHTNITSSSCSQRLLEKNLCYSHVFLPQKSDEIYVEENPRKRTKTRQKIHEDTSQLVVVETSAEGEKVLDLKNDKSNQDVPDVKNLIDQNTYQLIDRIKLGRRSTSSRIKARKCTTNAPPSPRKRVPWFMIPRGNSGHPLIFEGTRIADYPDLRDKINFKRGNIKVKRPGDVDPVFLNLIKSLSTKDEQLWKSTLSDKIHKIDMIDKLDYILKY